MRIAAITRGGVIGVDAHTRAGCFVTLHAVEVAFQGGGFLRVPPGFVFDGASIPARLRSVIQSITNAGTVALVTHDYAYAIGATWISPKGHRRPVSRVLADRMAWAVGRYLGLASDDAIEIYAALRIGGAGSYQKRAIHQTVVEWCAANP